MISALPLVLLVGLPQSHGPTITWKTLESSGKRSHAVAKVPQFSGGPVAKFASRELLRNEQRHLNQWRQEVKELESEPVAVEVAYESKGFVSLAKANVISVVFQGYTNTGGAHPNTFFTCYNFFLKGRKPARLKLRDMFTANPAAQVNRIIIAKLKATGRASYVDEGTVKELSAAQMEQFVVTEKGLTFFFEPYAVAPYAAGPFEIKVLFTELKNVRLPWSSAR